MDNQLDFLYDQIKERKISQEEARQQIEEYKTQCSEQLIPSPSLRNEYNIVPEKYIYDEPYLRDHTVYNEQVLIGVTHASLAINAFYKIFPLEDSVHLHNLNFVKPIEVKKDQQVEVKVETFPKGSTTDIQVLYRYASSEAWNVTATGNLQKTLFAGKKVDIASIKDALEEFHRLKLIYTGNPAVGLGDSIQNIDRLYTGKDQVLAKITLTQTSSEENHDYILHPLIINSAFLAVHPLIEPSNSQYAYLPFGIKDIQFRRIKGLVQCWLLVKLVKNSGEMVIFDADVITDASQVIAHFSGCSIKRIRATGEISARDHLIPGATEPQQSQEIPNLHYLDTVANTPDIAGKIQKYLIAKLSKIVPDRSRLQNLKVNLMDLGLESSQLVAMTNEITQETNIELYPTLFFEYPSIKELAEYFSQEHQDSFIQLLAIDAKQSGGSNASGQTVEFIPAKTKEVLQPEQVQMPAPMPSNRSICTDSERDDIAVIGMHGIFAEAANLDQFWHNLRDKKDVMKEIPLDHWDYRPWYDENPEAKNKTYCKWGSFINDVDKFDAGFFNISPREAEWMDPQLRLLLQSIYATGEDAGYINQLRGTNTGVFVGVCFHDYADRIAEMNLPVDPYMGTGNVQTVIANRVSFLFDFTGPSVAVDTACSSSLFALHYACHALRNKECDLAFVGGVNLLLSSFHYRYFSSINALSPTGRCHAFDEAADGYVPGECIASILLKPLQQAKRDGDHIYAIIKGSAALHGGYTPSLTAPSVAGEENVILKAWEDAGINPETLSFIEAHGTGTKLGDPVEINSLKKAFKQFTTKEHFCAVGSVKANIGHTEGAAGIAAILKVILQMKHKQIAVMPQFKTLNHYIQLDKSPLYINQELEEWKSPVGIPRRAGVSSFGFAGAYAHIVIEEYIAQIQERPQLMITAQNPAIIVLSAKNEKQLYQQAGQLLAAIGDQQFSEVSLADMAYTLQVGREAMEERLGLIVGSVKELEEKLKRFMKGQDGIEDLYRGQVKRNKETLAVFAADEELQEAFDKWIQRGKYTKLMDLWVKGLIFDWNKLYGDNKPCRISLPTYPFTKERYWIPEIDTGTSNAAASVSAVFFHPLLHHNTSDFSEQRFSSTFTGQEFFLADHIVKGRRVLPGVAHMEMVRAALAQAMGDWEEGQAGIRLKNIVWLRPIVIGDQPVQVHTGLFAESNGKITFEIYSELKETDIEPVVYSQGSAVLSPVTEVPVLDLKTLQAECNKSSLAADQCYEIFRSMGFYHAPGYQGVEMMYVGEGQVLAKLALPASVGATKDQFVLHPSLLDSSLHAALGLRMNAGDLKLALPFALQEVEIYGRCTAAMWSLVRYSDGSAVGDKIQKFDIDLCDDQGKVCVRMKGFSTRELEGEVSSVASEVTHGTLLLVPCWQEHAIIRKAPACDYAHRLVMLCEHDEVFRESIETAMGVRCINLESQQNGIEERFRIYATKVFEEIQSTLNDKPNGQVLIQIVIPLQEERQIFSGLTGLLKTVRLEHPKLIGQLIEVGPGEDSEGIIEKLKENSHYPADNHVRYQDGKRLLAGWSEAEVSQEMMKIPWKDRGVYLITGGAGNLGLIFAEEIAHKVEDATLILTGRSPISEAKQVKLEELRVLGVQVVYKQVDVTQRQAVADLIRSIQDDFGNLNGIIHGAGVIRDNFILKKTTEELQEVLAPKVSGLVNLDQASKDLQLDFFVLFSSIAGSLGNPGQADYATANAFMDAYAGYRNGLVASKQRQGQTVSINWPLWQEGGMRVDAETKKLMLQSLGMTAMETPSGIWALYQSLASCKDQVMVVAGNLARMKQKLLSLMTPATLQPENVSVASTSTTGINTGDLLDKVQTALRQAVFELLKVKDIDVNIELNEYGFDSITLTEFTNKLNREYKLELTPTIFFEYPTINSFANYLIEEYQAMFANQFDLQTRVTEPLVVEAEAAESEIHAKKKQRRRFAEVSALLTAKPGTSVLEPIAIIGMSGIFPMARDVNEFWQNLVEGRDCITEIPQDRWDWRQYYGDPVKEANKTNIKWGGFIAGVDEFDPLFFGISPREAELMDPQQRLLMLYVWKAIEDAGYSAQSLSGTSAGIFVGTTSTGYSGLISRANIAIEGYSSTGTVPSVGPNRMSYFLNIHGPSEPIETACSSSLVALHRAVNAIENGSCDMAIAGGVNTIVTPDYHISFNKAGMLCEDGRCKTFSDQANGYVRGEGAGMLFLKRLKDAERDGDHIYGVIRSTAENHGGRANSLTAPNPKAQTELLKTAYTKAGIDPRTVSYIEAHGTGTELGDPIEINGLKAAFKELYQTTGDSQVVSSHCGLGSVKTNIGHLELAAGVAGVIKVLLQIKHKTLVKTLHCNTLNPYIQLQDSPFYIVQEAKEWKPLQDAGAKDLPRRAGVSSFGFGGANAHIVIEEYIPQNSMRSQITITSQQPAIIVLSAKNEERLKAQAQQLLVAIREQQFADDNLVNAAYTLQVGREAMEERLGLIVGSIKELEEKLKGFVKGENGIENLYRGQVKRNKETLAVFVADEDMAKTIDAWIAKGKYTKLLDLWVKGLIFDWNKMYGDNKPCRISLPTYPFAREKYWVSERAVSTATSLTAAVSIHPLLHQNTSDFYEQRFSSTFTGREFFLVNHVLQGQRVLPGVTYLEMARAAVAQSIGASEDGRTRIRLKNVVWVRPVALRDQPVEDQAAEIHIGLYQDAHGEIVYEVYSEPEVDGAEPIVYSQGIAVLGPSVEVPTVNIKALLAECKQGSYTSTQWYEAIGSVYGPGFQGVEMIYLASNYILAKLSLPSCVSDTWEQFVLHPTLLDSAVQVPLILPLINAGNTKIALPFALQELEILGKCTPVMWALVRDSENSAVGDKVRHFDVDLCDEQGNICVRMKKLSSRELQGEIDLVGSSTTIGNLMVEPMWREQAIVQEAKAPDYEQRLVILCEPGDVTRESIETKMNEVRFLTLHSPQEGIEERFQVYALQVFEEIQNILKNKPAGNVLIQIIVYTQAEQQLFSGLSGLLNTACLENTKLIGQLIEVEPGEDVESVIEKLRENSQSRRDKQIRYQNGKRYVAGWSEVEVSQETVSIPWKDRGIYLITGGAGDLGFIFAKEIAHKVKDAILILTGRSLLNEDKEAKLEELQALGARVEYRTVDVTQKKAVADLIRSIQDDFRDLNGIIHGAGVLRDNFIFKKTKEELQEVLAPKVTGLVNLDQASKDLKLDFFVLFSSIAVMGNPGQADYAAANAFMDAYAKYRYDLVIVEQRHGQTLSVNWPLWKEGGMHINAEIEKMMWQNTGAIAMQTPTGIRSLYQGLASGLDRFMVMEGNLARMKQKLLSITTPAIAQSGKVPAVFDSTTEIDVGGLLDKVQAALMQVTFKLLKVNSEDIDPDIELNQYGFDSITLTEFANKLNQEYKLELTPTIFFEHANIRSLAEYLIREHQAVFVTKFAVQTKVEIPVQAMEDERKEILSDKKRRPRFARTVALSAAKPDLAACEPVAIVGMSGRLPMARDINEFWKNLAEGKDCIAKIPKDRWDWREFYGDPTKEENKTNIKWGGFIDGVDEFDPLFFGISPREAQLMDPQQRLLMIYVWKAIEDAGYSAQSISGTKTALFVGTGVSGYHGLISRANIAIEGYTSTGTVPSVGPNRMSYFLNLNGPSEPIETACSSSLIALHRAVNAIENGTCEMAIAGGINTIVTPDFHISFNKAGMLCEDGRCKTFSNKANGYVRGEGVGMFFLKRLKDAERDGDHIYGVIRGTAENHGGRANSLTAPNPKAQAELLKTAYTKAGIDPRTVTYIEAHGTGTELGDPIEINGLTTAFKELYEATGDPQVVSSHCGLGSVKTNIGHLELAAGAAGVIKVLLQLKHKTLVKSLHADTISPYIQLKDSPFYVVQEMSEWKSLQDAQGKAIPRRAGVSSFGFGGANAHIVVEEYIPKDLGRTPITITPQNPAIIVLSAKNEERLKEQVQQLLDAIQEQQLRDNDLADIAYTLQVGREAMEARVGLIAGSIKELEEKLKGFAEGKAGKEDLYQGQVKRNKDTLAAFAADEDMAKIIDVWIGKGKYTKLLDLWVKGLIFDWNKLYGDSKPHRISLPTYPFARERYWVPESKSKFANSIATNLTTAAFIHPLLHQNTSDFYEQRFSAIFTGREFFLADHVLKGQRVLLGVAYLEMARAAVEQAAGTLEENQTGIRLKNVIWARPIAVGEQPVQVHIGLSREANGEIAYEIYSDSNEVEAEFIVHSQGNAVLSAVGEVPTLDLQTLQVRCRQKTFSSGQCYEAFKAMGIEYGPGHQGIEKLYAEPGQVLAKLSLPASVCDTQDQFVLHPSLMDSALQASIGWVMTTDDLQASGSIAPRKPALPFALQEIEILSKCTPVMWVLVRCSNGSKAGDQVQRLDIDLCDEQGNICVRMKGLEIQESTETVHVTSLETKPPSVPVSQPQEPFEMMTFEEVWQEQDLPDTSPVKLKTLVCFLSHPDNQQAIVAAMQALDQQTKVIFVSQSTTYQKESQQEYGISRNDGNSYREAFQNIRDEYGEVDAILYLWALEDPGYVQDYASIVYILQAVAAVKLKAKRCLLAAQFADGLERCYLESWVAFERSLGLVLPHTQVAVIYQEACEQSQETAMKDWLQKLIAELQTKKAKSVLYQEGKRHVYKIQPTTIQPGNSLMRSGGTYLITGGFGGLGSLFAEYFAQQHPVNLILTGRSPIDIEKRAKIKALEDLGSQVLYVQADVCDPSRMKEGLIQAKERFGGIHGVIHAAGVEGHQMIFEKEIQSFQKVLDPKIKGTLVLDEVLQEETLDFICYFSSSSAILGDFGSCDYAIGNRFLMAYAHYRNQKQCPGQQQGKAVVINWPLWKDGGMGLGNDENTKMYLKSSGQRFLEGEEGVDMFDRILTQTNIQHLVLVGEPSRIQRFLGLPQKQVVTTSVPVMAHLVGKGRRAEMKGMSVEQCLEWDLKEHVSKLLQISRDKIDSVENLADFGFDSISLAEFATLLSNHYGMEITPALFFGYATLEKLCQYFITEQQAAIEEFYKEQAAAEAFPKKVQAPAITAKRQGSQKARFTVRSIPQSVAEPIAIIGMSGRFPQANTVEELWKNLTHGKNSITEIPTERWDWREYYGEFQHENGKIKSKWGGFIADIDRFDPLFFEISPREAEIMDPRQRLFLEEAWHALEDAGYMGERIRGMSCGVYAGVEEGEYGFLVGEDGQVNSNQNATLAARIAYTLNLKGPNLALTAACSSGLVAIHQACQALRQGECEMALVGGISLMISPMTYIGLSKFDMLSPDGKCCVFDQRANGLVPSEAVAVVLLKPLSKAILDKDQIYGCIKASGVNYNGKSNGITAPNPLSQAELMNNIYGRYHVNPAKIQYVLSHSVGSKLGDPIEIQALSSAFGKYTDKKQYCNLGSVKPLIGHTFAASGVVSLISILMAMKYQTMPALHNYESGNEYINFKESPFILSTENQIWVTPDNQPRTGAISTTGISGTNAHAVIEEYLPHQEKAVHIRSTFAPQVIVLSAKNSERLQAVAQQMIDFIELDKELSLSDVAYTLQVGREAMGSRLAMVVGNQAELIQGLKGYLKFTKEGKEIEASIPIFAGNMEEDHAGIRSLLSGKVGETVIEMLLAENNLGKIALHWTQGGRIPWEALHKGKEVRRVSLPTYPFEKRRCWIEPQPEARLMIEQHRSLDSIAEIACTSIDDHVINIISHLLGMSSSEINLSKPMHEYGFDSIMLLQLLRQLQTEVDPIIDLVKLQESRTVQDIINVVRPQNGDRSMLLKQQTKITMPAAWPQFPELIRLNQGSQGRPVFWFHPIQGGVETYNTIAQKSKRPFYGIQARGWMTDQSPLYGIKRIASYYAQIVQSVQPEGPYDLGGYSLGGVLAYEVTRQLQELEHAVHTIVMVDAPDSIGLKQVNLSPKSRIFNAVNMALAATVRQEPEKLLSILIHRDELNANIGEGDLLQQLIILAKTRGLTKTETQLYTLIQQTAKVQQAYELNNYAVLPLPDPQAISCYYFRNKSGLFLGALEPYLTIATGEILLDHINYWEEWEQQLPNFHMIDVDSPNHFMLLSEPKASETILAFCKNLYSAKGVSADL